MIDQVYKQIDEAVTKRQQASDLYLLTIPTALISFQSDIQKHRKALDKLSKKQAQQALKERKRQFQEKIEKIDQEIKLLEKKHQGISPKVNNFFKEISQFIVCKDLNARRIENFYGHSTRIAAQYGELLSSLSVLRHEYHKIDRQLNELLIQLDPKDTGSVEFLCWLNACQKTNIDFTAWFFHSGIKTHGHELINTLRRCLLELQKSECDYREFNLAHELKCELLKVRRQIQEFISALMCNVMQYYLDQANRFFAPTDVGAFYNYCNTQSLFEAKPMIPFEKIKKDLLSEGAGEILYYRLVVDTIYLTYKNKKRCEIVMMLKKVLDEESQSISAYMQEENDKTWKIFEPAVTVLEKSLGEGKKWLNESLPSCFTSKKMLGLGFFERRDAHKSEFVFKCTSQLIRSKSFSSGEGLKPQETKAMRMGYKKHKSF